MGRRLLQAGKRRVDDVDLTLGWERLERGAQPKPEWIYELSERRGGHLGKRRVGRRAVPEPECTTFQHPDYALERHGLERGEMLNTRVLVLPYGPHVVCRDG